MQNGTIRRLFSSVLFYPLLFDNLRHCNDEREERCINPPNRLDTYYSLLTSHGVSEAPKVARLLGEPGAEHAARAASPHHPPPA